MQSFIAVDIETTGLSPEKNHIIEIGALKYVDGVCVETFSELVKPPVSISYRIYEITGINDKTVEHAAPISVVMKKFLDFVGEEQVLLGHNLKFDYSFLKTAAKQQGLPFEKKGLDTLLLARKFLPELPSKNLATVSTHYGILNERAHRAYEDAKTTAEVYFAIWKQFQKSEPEAFLPREMQYKVKKVEPATERQKNYLIDLLKYHKIQVETFFDEKGTTINDLTKSQASKMIDGLILQYGRIRR